MLDNNMKSFHENKDKSMEKDQTYDANIGENHCKYQGPGPYSWVNLHREKKIKSCKNFDKGVHTDA